MAGVKRQRRVKSGKKRSGKKSFRVDALCAEAYETHGAEGAVFFSPSDPHGVLKVGKMSPGD